jgi:hypothetical protein
MPGIEILEITLRFLRVDQNSRDQKPRQNEEKIYPHSSIAHDHPQMERRIYVSIMDKHREHGQAADSI